MTNNTIYRGRIGLMADSHGNVPATIAGIHCLQNNGVAQIYHLGDLFDSLLDNDFMTILQAVCNNDVLCVKGNNDYQVEQAIAHGMTGKLSAAERALLAEYLHDMPMIREFRNICMAHSLPYNSIRAFYEPIDDGGILIAKRIFRDTNYSLILCGHSHQSVLFRYRDNAVSREVLTEKYLVPFSPKERYILIVGSVDNGECGLLDFDQNTYLRLRIFEDQ